MSQPQAQVAEPGVPLSLHALIDQFAATHAAIDDLNQSLKRHKAIEAALEGALIQALDAQGVRQTSTQHHTASITETVVASVKDWDAFYRFIHQHEAFHLLERRPANAAYRELLQHGQTIPGVISFTKRGLSFRKC